MKEAAMIQIAVGRARAPLSLDWDLACGHQARAGVPMSDTAKYGRTEREWQELEQAGWDFLKAKAAGRRGDAAHDPTVSYSDANEELATRTGQPAFDFGQQAGRAAIGYLLGRISRNRSWPVSRLLISALVRYHGEADAGPGFFNLARDVGLIHGSLSNLERLEFWLRHVRQVQAYDWDQA
jgi:hypothetical protein